VTQWDELTGQDEAVRVVEAAAAASDTLAHSWLITGPPGSGRSTLAYAFAALLLSQGEEDGGARARAMVHGRTHPDLSALATDRVVITMDEVRRLVAASQYSPSVGLWRVVVIEDADRMAERTSNVLLKAIEEPPGRTVWLLCAPSPQDVVVTIRSRSRSVALRVPPPDAVAQLLVTRDGVAPELAAVVARAAQSHIGVARRLARDPEARARRDQVLAIPGEIRGVGDAVLAAGELVEVSQAEAKSSTADRDAAERAELLRSLGAEGGGTLPPALRAQVNQLEKDQKRRATRAQRDVLDRAMVDLLSLYRDVLTIQLGAQVELMNIEHAAQVEDLAAASTPEQTLRRMDAIGVARTRLAGNVAPLLAVEAMALALRPQARQLG